MVAQKIKAAVEQAIAKARKLPKDHPVKAEVIDWTDLRIVDIELVAPLLSDDQIYIRVLIEAATPDCPGFCQFIWENIPPFGMPVIIVLNHDLLF